MLRFNGSALSRNLHLLAAFIVLVGWTLSAGAAEDKPDPGPVSSPTLPSLLAPTKETIHVAVSIVPEAYFVERIGGDRVQVQVLVASGQSPHTYDPTPREMAELSQADVYFRIGMPFEESSLRKIESAKKDLRIVDISKSLVFLAMTEDATEEEPGAEHEEHAHRRGEPDPHVWLDPGRVEIMARAICATLLEIQPGNRPYFDRNLRTFVHELGETDEKIAEMLAPFRGRTFYVFHPSFRYFASAYGLEQAAVELGGKEPGSRHMAQLIDRLRAEGVKTIYVQPQFSSRTASAVAEAIGGRVVAIDPLAKDYLANLVKTAEAIRDGFASGARNGER
ncbi:zinc ABC transporter substrate-binding protein [Candidatus Sumerlaeota bacterium]|nr:zinc ABC transporter substrate-binding protein [Candidatus Sumerlaeota bacterium]